jgi:hypothetical protein
MKLHCCVVSNSLRASASTSYRKIEKGGHRDDEIEQQQRENM